MEWDIIYSRQLMGGVKLFSRAKVNFLITIIIVIVNYHI